MEKEKNMKSVIITIALIAGLLIAPAYSNAATGNKLESYNVDLKETSVSGISSGA
jgi:hypothetical protein